MVMAGHEKTASAVEAAYAWGMTDAELLEERREMSNLGQSNVALLLFGCPGAFMAAMFVAESVRVNWLLQCALALSALFAPVAIVAWRVKAQRARWRMEMLRRIRSEITAPSLYPQTVAALPPRRS